jgi:hypothetical protein
LLVISTGCDLSIWGSQWHLNYNLLDGSAAQQITKHDYANVTPVAVKHEQPQASTNSTTK